MPTKPEPVLFQYLADHHNEHDFFIITLPCLPSNDKGGTRTYQRFVCKICSINRNQESVNFEILPHLLKDFTRINPESTSYCSLSEVKPHLADKELAPVLTERALHSYIWSITPEDALRITEQQVNLRDQQRKAEIENREKESRLDAEILETIRRFLPGTTS